jgi:regulator of cell morphogenesis and NO signaling
MTALNLETTVGDWVARQPRASRVFETLHIDYCCGGGVSLEQACRKRALAPEEVLARLYQVVEDDGAKTERDWTAAPLAELCDHVEQTHHAHLRTELPRLSGLIEKVVRAHSAVHRELFEVQQVFAGLRGELESHTMKEERVLFPAIRQLERAETRPDFPFGTVANPIRRMEHEHDDAGNALARLRELTHAFRVPEGACNTYRAMLDGLRELEQDLHQHIHKENNILFPRAVAHEKGGAQPSSS